MQASAIVLAGGNSTRMGADKALLRIGSATILERAVEVLRCVADDVLIVGRPSDAGLPAPSVPDEIPDRGPLGGLLTGLSHARHRYVICVSCDLPFLNPDVIALLLTHARGHDAVVPVIEGRPEPLHAVYARRVRSIAERHLAADRDSMRELLQSLRVCEIHEEEILPLDSQLRSFLNANTPQDWRAVLASESAGP